VSQPATPRRFPSHRLLRRPALLALLPLLPLMGCGGGSKPRREEVVPPFVFRSLNLRQQTPTGKPAWELTSPEARYDLRRRIAQAISPKGVIYAAGRPLYRVQADSGTVVNDGEVILLEGNLRVERIGREPVLIQASRARWLPRQQLMLIDRRPVAWDRLGRLRAERARFLFQEDRLELSGQPQLDRWNQRFDPFTALPTIPPAIVVQAAAVRWKPGSGELQADGPLIGQRKAAVGEAAAAPQQLSAEGLSGNTLTQEFTLTGRVRFNDPARGDSFAGRDVRLSPAANEGSSARPFEASRGSLQVSGASVQVEGTSHWVRIDGACRLVQPEGRLQADRCGWNWQSGAVEAEGGVVVERTAQNQISRGGILSGRLGREGSVLLRAPGGRVVSQFQVPRRPAQAPPPLRPAPEPIVP